MAAPALSLILCVVLVVSFWPEVRAFFLLLEQWARRAEERLADLWAGVLVVVMVTLALPGEVVARIRRR